MLNIVLLSPFSRYYSNQQIKHSLYFDLTLAKKKRRYNLLEVFSYYNVEYSSFGQLIYWLEQFNGVVPLIY